MSEHKYTLKYSITPGEYTKEQLKSADEFTGGCDQLLLCSYVEHADGSGSYAWVSSNGNGDEEMEPHRQFKCLIMLVNQLAKDERLGEGHRMACSTFFELVRAAMIKSTQG